MSQGMNVVVARFSPGQRTTKTQLQTRGNYGQILKIEGLEQILPEYFEMHFSNSRRNSGTAKTQIGHNNEVKIPYEYIYTGMDIYAWVFLHEGDEDGTSKYIITIANSEKPTVIDSQPLPDEQSAVSQVIEAANNAIARSNQRAEDSEAWAVGTRNGTAVEDGDDTYHNNSKYYAEQSGQSADDSGRSASAAHDSEVNAGRSETNAHGYMERAEGAKDFVERNMNRAETAADKAEALTDGTVNGVPVEEGDLGYNDNARYYKDMAAQSAAESGYMHFYIDENGHLIYERTSTVDVQFELVDGDLYIDLDEDINLGHATAYAYAVAGGYQGTEAEFETLLGNIAADLNEIENISASATLLPEGSNPTASYTNGALSFGIPKGDPGEGMTVETVTGTDPVITGEENTRYICGEVSSITITPPQVGVIDVRFTSGTTPAVLSLPNTVIMPEWFSTPLEADRAYEICITDGVYGMVMSWAV